MKQLISPLIVLGILLAAPTCRAVNYPINEVARHNTAGSCWMAIEGKVYDLTSYLDEHRIDHRYDMLKWCGHDASSGWKDKDGKNKPHKRKATLLLDKYLIGDLMPATR